MGYGVRDDNPDRTPKVRQSARIAADVESFLARGGAVVEVAQGVSGEVCRPSPSASRGGKAKSRTYVLREREYALMLERRQRRGLAPSDEDA